MKIISSSYDGFGFIKYVTSATNSIRLELFIPTYNKSIIFNITVKKSRHTKLQGICFHIRSLVYEDN